MNPNVAQMVRNQQRDGEIYAPPGGEDIQGDDDRETREVDSGNEAGQDSSQDQNNDQTVPEDQEDDVIRGTPSPTQNLPDISVTGIIKVLQNRQGKWYFCHFSDGKDGYLEYKERQRIPQHIRDSFHKQFTWKNKKKRCKQRS